MARPKTGPKCAKGRAVRLSGLLGALILLLSSLVQGAPSDSQPTAHLVEVVYVGRSEDAAALRNVVDELLRRLAVEWHSQAVAELDLRDVITPRSEPPELLARVWFDLRGPDKAVLYLVDRSWDR